MIRFLHAADLHLDSPLRGLADYEGAPTDRIRGASRRALDNLVQLALDERVDFVLLAGDIYDGDWHDVGTGLFFVRQMAKLYEAGIAVFIIAGNHDAANRMSRRLPYPDNVRVLDHQSPETVRLDDIGVAIHGQSYANQAESENLARSYPAAVKNMLNIGLLHTALTGREGHEPYAPCLLEDLESRGYDYWALGHVHQRESVSRSPYLLVEFPGNLQGRHVRETGAKGCLLVTANDSGEMAKEFRPLDVVRWGRIVVPCDDAQDRDEINERIQSALVEAHADAGGRLLAARVELTGTCDWHDALLAQESNLRDDVRALSQSLGEGAAWIEKVLVRTSRPQMRTPIVEVGDDALSEIAAVITDLDQDSELLRSLLDIDDLKTLATKVPAELKDGDGSIALADPAWARPLLDRARALLNLEARGKEAGR